jgi:transcriptional regulator with XRE-family HTH domain
MQPKETHKIPLHEQLRSARKNKKLSQKEVALAVDYSLQMVKYWEGEGNKTPIPTPRKDAMDKLEQLYGVRLSSTGNVSGALPDYAEGMSADAIRMAKAIDAMPEDLRENLIAIIDRLTLGFEPAKARRTAVR